jgi:hypothetical protein
MSVFDKNYFLAHMDTQVRELGADRFVIQLHLRDGTIYEVETWTELTDGYVMLSVHTPESSAARAAVAYEYITHVHIARSETGHRTTMGFRPHPPK